MGSLSVLLIFTLFGAFIIRDATSYFINNNKDNNLFGLRIGTFQNTGSAKTADSEINKESTYVEEASDNEVKKTGDVSSLNGNGVKGLLGFKSKESEQKQEADTKKKFDPFGGFMDMIKNLLKIVTFNKGSSPNIDTKQVKELDVILGKEFSEDDKKLISDILDDKTTSFAKETENTETKQTQLETSIGSSNHQGHGYSETKKEEVTKTETENEEVKSNIASYNKGLQSEGVEVEIRKSEVEDSESKRKIVKQEDSSQQTQLESSIDVLHHHGHGYSEKKEEEVSDSDTAVKSYHQGEESSDRRIEGSEAKTTKSEEVNSESKLTIVKGESSQGELFKVAVETDHSKNVEEEVTESKTHEVSEKSDVHEEGSKLEITLTVDGDSS